VAPEVSASSPPQQPAPAPKARGTAAPAPAPVAVEASAPQLDLEQVVRVWPAAVEILSEENDLLGAALAEAKPHALENGRLVIAFPPDSEFVRKKAEAKREVIQRALHALTGSSPALAFETSQDAVPAQPRLTTDELIESVKRDFEATEVEES
jgi:hypothetical protein